MVTGQNQEHITHETEPMALGLYVDTADNWTVKATSDTSLWDKFEISGFVTSPMAGGDVEPDASCISGFVTPPIIINK